MLTDPALSIPPGSLLYGKNYEVYPEGGYRRVDGFERFDGRLKPSESIYYILEFDNGQVEGLEGEPVRGATSGATATLIADTVVESGSFDGDDAAGYMAIAILTGTFQIGENIIVGALGSNIGGVATAVEKSLNAPTDALDDTYSQASIEEARSNITVVPGSGPIRGVWVYNGVVYAFRDDSGGAECKLYKATTSGWTAVDLGSFIEFDLGTEAFAEGDTIKQADTDTTAIVRRVALRTGTYGIDDAVGLFALSDISHTVTSVTITDGGSGYTDPETTPVTFSAPPSGTTATGSVTISAGSISVITIENAGSGYLTAPTITLGGTGSGFAGTVVISDAFADNKTLYKHDTTVLSTINSSVTTVPVTDVTDFPDSGTVTIGTEKITYTGKTGTTSLTGCVRGAHDTTAAGHTSGAVVMAHRATAKGLRKTVTLVPGGRYEFINYNFGGSSASNRMYGCDGFNPAFEFDGTYWVPIYTGMDVDTPRHLTAHKKHLFLAFHKGSLQHSGIGLPYSWTVITGAAELGTGDEITGLQVMRGDSMAIFNRNRTYILYGTSVGDWNLKTFSNNSGAVEYTVQNLAETIYLDDRGVTNLSAVNAYGDFAISSLSRKIKPVIDSKKGKSISSVRVRSKGQYRLFFNDGTAVFGTFAGNKLAGFIRVDLGKVVYSVCSAEDADGNEILFFGSDDGYIYQMDKGTSFDGTKVEAMLRLSYYHYDTPTRNKRFRKIHFEMTADSDVSLKFMPAYSYDDPQVPEAREQAMSVSGGGGYWNIDDWDTFNWSSAVVSTAEHNIEGVGTNMGLLILSEATYEQPHTLQGVTVHYSPRRIRR